MRLSLSSLSEARIAELLAARAADPGISPLTEFPGITQPRPAAVLIPLLRHEDQWHLLFILRAQVEGDMHSAQVAFPGGRLEPDETQAQQAALREANEEIGLEPEGVRLLGALEDFITISSYRVTPVVGVIPWPFEIKPDPAEVQRAFIIPLAWLADASHREERQRALPDGRSVSVVYFTEYDREIVWGVTARITLNFLEALQLA